MPPCAYMGYSNYSNNFELSIVSEEMQMPKWNGKRISKEELDAKFKFFESPELQAKIKEGFDQIERGEYVSYPLDEIKLKLRNLKIG